VTVFSAVPVTEQGASLERTHLVGVGGAGMSGIARILADRGFAVSGSDARDSAVLAGLADRGVRTAVGHSASNLSLLVGGPTAVVVSTAVRPDNPEVVAARAGGIPVVRRADALAALMSGLRSVCVAGTHGKTSTTSMLTVALQHAGLDPSFAIGGELTGSGLGAHHGDDDVFVAEADESDGSFLSFSPHGAVVTNIEPDHLDHHGTAEAYTAVFDQFVDRIEPGGFLVVCADDAGAAALAERTRLRRLVTYGRVESATVRLGFDPSEPGPAVVLADGTRVPLRLTVPGDHMLLNAVAALAAGVELGVDPGPLAAGLAEYTGVRRRFERRGSAAGVTVFDDYAHHPTEVAAQLAAARGVVADQGRLVVVFQPHLYSRTETFAAEFGGALASADVVVVLDVYGAREDPRPGVSGELVAAAVPAGPVVRYHPQRSSAAGFVAGLVRAGDLVITMGAGDVTVIGPELLALLEDPDRQPTEGRDRR
jgi:UDP-N-acetylmuramate--alanine ligase